MTKTTKTTKTCGLTQNEIAMLTDEIANAVLASDVMDVADAFAAEVARTSRELGIPELVLESAGVLAGACERVG